MEMSDPTGGVNLLLAVETHATPNADQLDREATDLEAVAYAKRVEAFRLRALARMSIQRGDNV
jgi:hypothetical protein